MNQINKDILDESNRYALRCEKEMHKAHEERVNLQVKLDIAIKILEDIAEDLLCSEKHYLVKDINEALEELK